MVSMKISELYAIEGKTAVITGAAQGLGREIALAFAHNGANVVVSDIRYPEETAKEVQAAGARCLAIQADISDEVQIATMAEKVLIEYGRVDILVNNAGVSQLSYTATEKLSKSEWDTIIGINLTGTFLCCKHFGKGMIDSGGGSIVNIATTAGFTGVTRAPAYSASKAGVVLLTKSLALEWAPCNVRVNAVAPHYLETALTEGLMENQKVYQSLIKQIPLRRFGKPSEIVGAVIYLASGASSYTTGAVIAADGGYLAQ